MEKITTAEQVRNMDYNLQACLALGIRDGVITDENFWRVREQARFESGEYTRTKLLVVGDDTTHFLHVSIDDPTRVSYTRDADKGRQDLQTKTTLEAYCEKFDLNVAVLQYPAAIRPLITHLDDAPKADPARDAVFWAVKLEDAKAEVVQATNALRALLG